MFFKVNFKFVFTIVAVLAFFCGKTQYNWYELTNANIMLYKKYNIKKVSFLENSAIQKTIEFDSTRQLFTTVVEGKKQIFQYNAKNKIINLVEHNRVFEINYFDDDTTIKSLSCYISNKENDTLLITSFPYMDRLNLPQNEYYFINKKSKDTTTFFLRKTILNSLDNGQTYELRKEKYSEEKKYYNGNYVVTHFLKNRVTYDSSVRIAANKYHHFNYEFYPDSTNIVVIKDSTHYQTVKNGKLIFERVSFLGKNLYEVKYDSQGTNKYIRTVYYYLPNKWKQEILWKKVTFNANSRKLKTEYAYKSRYKYRKGILIEKKKNKTSFEFRCSSVIWDRTYVNDKWVLSSTAIIANDTLDQISSSNYPLGDRIKNLLGGKQILKNEIYFQEWKFLPILSASDADFWVDEKAGIIKFPLYCDSSYMKLKTQTKDYRIELATTDNKMFLSPSLNIERLLKQEYLVNFFAIKEYSKMKNY